MSILNGMSTGRKGKGQVLVLIADKGGRHSHQLHISLKKTDIF
jgi:ERCC4-related helicase